MNSIIRIASKLALRPILKVNKPIILNNFGPRRWAHNMPLTYDFARERIMLVLRLFDKIDGEKITLDSHFFDDLGLDSLDHVEIIMQLEDEFYFEIPDKDAEKLMRPRDILKYITDKEEAYEELQKLQAHSHHGHGHGNEHGHGHGNEHGHGHGHEHGHVAQGSAGDHATNTAFSTTKRHFSTLTYVSKRYTSGEGKGTEHSTVYPTSFAADPKEEVNFDDIQKRVMKVCAKYDKIDSSKLELASHFVDDLGLDSLDHVEIMMELEDEFGLEIPDQEAEKLMRPAEVARYIFEKEEERSISVKERKF